MQLLNTSLFASANLVAYYRLEAGALTTDSKNSNTLTNANTVAEATGVYGGASSTGATNATNKLLYRLADGGFGATSTTPFSQVGWYKFNAIGASSPLANWCSNNTFSRHSWDQSSGSILFYRVNETVQQGPTYSWTPTVGIWYHIGMTYDGTNVRGYLNGALVGGPTAASGTRTTSETEGIGIGIDGQAFNTLTSASTIDCDDVAFFTTAISDSEMAILASQGSGFFGLM